MGVQKIVKTKSYYKRYQVKMRRRRSCKTDYQARRTMIVQDCNKYNTPKFRLVVRVTNKDIIAQLVAARVAGDDVIAAAYAHELPRYGVKAGLTNYAACYCTGLLLARRALKKVGLEKFYEGNTEPNGEMFENEVNDEMDEDEIKRPLRAYLDVGLSRTTTGARLFGVLKGAVDGGLDVPHREKRFPGAYRTEGDKGEDKFEADVHRKYIFGGHVADYMKKMQEDSEDKYKAHFAKYIAAGIAADGMEEMYAKAHAAIRANPAPSAKKKVDPSSFKKTWPRKKKMPWAQRKARVQQKIANAIKKAE